MSKCSLCSNEATIHFVDIDASGYMREVFLCPKHAEAYGFSQKHAYALLDDLPARTVGKILSSTICPHCGCTQEWIQQQHQVGCPQCYSAFPKVRPKGFKQQALYFGKYPHNIAPEVALRPRLEFLQRQQQALARNDCFEAARALQGKIKSITQEMKNASADL